jgi:hypothetical protein
MRFIRKPENIPERVTSPNILVNKDLVNKERPSSEQKRLTIPGPAVTPHQGMPRVSGGSMTPLINEELVIEVNGLLGVLGLLVRDAKGGVVRCSGTATPALGDRIEYVAQLGRALGSELGLERPAEISMRGENARYFFVQTPTGYQWLVIGSASLEATSVGPVLRRAP